MQEYTYSERHMGTDTTVSFIVPRKSFADTMAADVFSQITLYEERFSRFSADSELSKLNDSGRQTVSEDFLAVLNRSLELADRTDNAFNPLIQVARLGYQANFSDLNTPADLDSTPYNTSCKELVVNQHSREVVLAPQQQLDFGGLLKGYLAHELGKEIVSHHSECTGSIINIGGDLFTNGFDELNEPFVFFIYNPITFEEIPITLTDMCLATSGTYQRSWQTSSGNRHHLVSSDTLQNPTTNFISVSVAHRDGAVAEAYTKLFLTRGEEDALRIAGNDDYEYILITGRGEVITNIV